MEVSSDRSQLKSGPTYCFKKEYYSYRIYKDNKNIKQAINADVQLLIMVIILLLITCLFIDLLNYQNSLKECMEGNFVNPKKVII